MAARAIHDEGPQAEQGAHLVRDSLHKAMANLTESQRGQDPASTIGFDEFLAELQAHPKRHLRNVHQVFHDMVHSYVGSGHDEYAGDPESIQFVAYDCTRLFVEVQADQDAIGSGALQNRRRVAPATEGSVYDDGAGA